MKYISKGLVCTDSTEDILKISHYGVCFTLTGMEASVWLNGRFGFSEISNSDLFSLRAAEYLEKKGLIETAENNEFGEYRALTRCVIVPAGSDSCYTLNPIAHNILKWIRDAGLRLTVAEIVYLYEHRILPRKCYLGANHRQELTELIYTNDTIFDNVLENQMEHVLGCMPAVRIILQLLNKKKIVLI